MTYVVNGIPVYVNIHKCTLKHRINLGLHVIQKTRHQFACLWQTLYDVTINCQMLIGHEEARWQNLMTVDD